MRTTVRRLIVRGIPVFLLTFALAAKCRGSGGGGGAGGGSGGGSGGAAPATRWPTGFGEADHATKAECTFDLAPATKCKGYYPLDFADPANAAQLAAWADPLSKENTNWYDLKDAAGSARFVERILDDEPPTLLKKRPKFGLSVISDSRQVPLAKFPTTPGGLILGQFEVKKNQELDMRYGISHARTKDYVNRKFFIVIDGWNPEQRERNKGFTFATWRVYGILKGQGNDPDRFVRVGSNAGAFRWCTMPHDAADQGTGVRFLSCIGASTVQAVSMDTAVKTILAARPVQQGKSLIDAIEYELNLQKAQPYRVTTEQLSSILKERIFAKLPTDGPSSFPKLFTADIMTTLAGALDLPENPAWLACGIGCCTADW